MAAEKFTGSNGRHLSRLHLFLARDLPCLVLVVVCHKAEALGRHDFKDGLRLLLRKILEAHGVARLGEVSAGRLEDAAIQVIGRSLGLGCGDGDGEGILPGPREDEILVLSLYGAEPLIKF